MDQTRSQSPLQIVLDRCGRIGLLACALRPDGTIEDVRGPHQLWCEVLKTPTMASTIRSTALSELPKRVRSQLGTTQLDETVWFALCPLSDDQGLRGSIALILPSENAGTSKLLQQAADETGMDPVDVPALVRATATYTQATVSLLAAQVRLMVSDVAAIARSEEEVEGFTKQLTGAFETIDLLYSLGRAMKAPFSPAEFLTSLCARARMTLSFGWVAVTFASTPRTPPSLQGMLVAHGDLPLEDDAFRSAIAPALLDTESSCRIRTDIPALTNGPKKQLLTQPLLCKGHQIGVLVAGDKFGDDPMVSSYDTQLIEACAGFMSTFVENVALYDEQQELFVGTLHALTAAIDAKDRYTRGHSERVALVSYQIAQLAGLPEPQCERIRIAGLVHDVGKIGVPESTLLKPGKLTEVEFGHIKKHPEIGFEILHQVPLLADVLPGVLHHHERYDGKGYPYGLSGTEIPLMARIIAVADTFDAMSSDRAYRARMPRVQVLAEIVRSAGTQLDPRLAQIMQKVNLAEYDALSARHAASEAKLAA
jgi:HD-GYP domain-containing protein (c-di-GMP phosphodiesterase class II)